MNAAFAAGLLEGRAPCPANLLAWNGSDPSRRYDVYRNNVTVSLREALAETFPVCRAMVGEEFFSAMARSFLQGHPPASRVLTRLGLPFADFIAGFEPAGAVPWLAEMARLEMARVMACHAADAAPVSAARLHALLGDPDTVQRARLRLQPSVRRIDSPWAVAALWAAHQHVDATRDALLASLDAGRAEACLIFRDDRDPLELDPQVPVVTLDAAAAACIDALLAGRTLSDAAASAGTATVLEQVLGLLLGHALIVDVAVPESYEQ